MVTVDALYPNTRPPVEGQFFHSKVALTRWTFEDLASAIALMQSVIETDEKCLGMQLTWQREG